MPQRQNPHHIAIFGNHHQAEKSKYVAQVIAALQAQGLHVEIEESFATFLQAQSSPHPISSLPLATFKAAQCSADLVVSMGGDGTFLNTVGLLCGKAIPILGVNTGRLGFLADVTPDDIETAMVCVARGEYEVQQRALIEVSIEGEDLTLHPYALNEVALLKHDNSSLIEINTLVDGQLLTNYLADGLIVCTPTGSTGYSLSVGGPVLEAQSATLCVSPVAPHSLTLRPIVLRDDVHIEMSVRSRSGSFLLAIDGRNQSLPENTRVHLRRATSTLPVVKMCGQNFFHTLREKLMWGKDQRNP